MECSADKGNGDIALIFYLRGSLQDATASDSVVISCSFQNRTVYTYFYGVYLPFMLVFRRFNQEGYFLASRKRRECE